MYFIAGFDGWILIKQFWHDLHIKTEVLILEKKKLPMHSKAKLIEFIIYTIVSFLFGFVVGQVLALAWSGTI